jgi:hypothetical protein
MASWTSGLIAGLAGAAALVAGAETGRAAGAAPVAKYCMLVSKTFTAPATLVADPKSIAHLWRASYNCFRADYSNQQVMYFTAAPLGHSEAFTGKPLLFDWDDNGAFLLIDVRNGASCAVTVEYWSEDGKCTAGGP